NDGSHDVLRDAEIADEPWIEVLWPRDRRRRTTHLQLHESRPHGVFNRRAVEHTLPFDADLAQEIREQLPARAQPLRLDHWILLHVVEEMLKGRFDPEVHLLLVRDDPVRFREPGLERSLDRLPV